MGYTDSRVFRFPIIFTALLPDAVAEWCNYDSYIDLETYCSTACCPKTCCVFENLKSDDSLPGILGGVIGGTILLVIIIVGVIFVCVHLNKHGRVITVITPAPVSTVAVSSTGTSVTGYGGQYGIHNPQPKSSVPQLLTPYSTPLDKSTY